MKKRLFKIGVLAAVFIVLGVLFFQIHAKLEDKRIIKSNTSFFHDLPLVGLDSSIIDLVVISKPVVLILFDSECSICKHEALDIKQHIDDYADFKILMVSIEPLRKIDDFANKTETKGYSQLIFAHIDPKIAYSYFGAYSVPSIFIYDKQRRLKKKFTGETKAETLLKYLAKQ